MSFETLVETLRRHVRSQPDKILFRHLLTGEVDGTREELTRCEFDRRARTIGAWLQQQDAAGERVLLLYPPGVEFMAGFLGCLYAGSIAVPAYPPEPSRLGRSLPRMQAIAGDAQARFVLTTSALQRRSASLLPQIPELEALVWAATDSFEISLGSEWRDPAADRNDIALLQYTSGSTGLPKGIPVRHSSLHHNLTMLQAAGEQDESSDIVCWMPVAHDMGLIMHILNTVYLGCTCTLMSPMDFVQRPLRWLEAISHFRAHTSGGPNFSFELCVRKSTVSERRRLDLSSWVVAWNAAEPVRAATLERFTETFAISSFRPEAFCPLFGLAESTVFVSCGRNQDAPQVATVDKQTLADGRWQRVSDLDEASQQVVGCGRIWLDQELLIVDPETLLRCPADQMGEVWVRSPSLPVGYWNRPQESIETFGAHLADTGNGPFLRTGDLGVLENGELFITGRLKDLIILAGLNHYPQDIEQTVTDSHPSLRPGCCAAFAVDDDRGEVVVVVAEMDAARDGGADSASDVIDAIRQAVATEHAVPLREVVLVAPRSIPKTNSGKIQRRGCQAAHRTGELTVIEASTFDPSEPAIASSAAMSSNLASRAVADHESFDGRDRLGSIEVVEQFLIERLAQRLGLQPIEIDVDRIIEHYGLGSTDMVAISGELADRFGHALPATGLPATGLSATGLPATGLPATLLYDYPTVRAIARHLNDPTPRHTVAPRLPVAPQAIAILGLGCRFPGAGSDAKAFWNMLRDGREALTAVPSERWDVDGVAALAAESRWGSFLSDIEGFDAGLFGLTASEATAMDPQQRLLLEVAWQAFENAGVTVTELADQRVGVFIGLSDSGYGGEAGASALADLGAFSITGTMPSVAVGRISYLLGLRGPSIAVDTSCSSSLVAVHLACQSLRLGECDLALAGGVNLLLSPRTSLALSRMGALASDGRCKAFSASADGFGRGEGCGLVVLRSWQQAQAAEESPLALIRASAVNHDGASNGLTAPNGRAQLELLRDCLQQAGVEPAEIDVVEAHGTGTKLGDPIELRALSEAFGPGRGLEQPLWVGSVKTNIGHLESAAGIAGLLKLSLAIHHGELPASLHCQELNPHLPWDDLPIAVATELMPWPRTGGERWSGVSSFGFSGTNAHLILSRVPTADANAAIPGSAGKNRAVSGTPETERVTTSQRPSQLLVLSAKSRETLGRLAGRYAQRLENVDASMLADVCYSACTGRSHLEHRLALMASSPEIIQSQLAAFAAGEVDTCSTGGTLHLGVRQQAPPKVAFLMTGQGSLWAGVGRDFYASQPVFRSVIDRCDAVLPDVSIVDVLCNLDEMGLKAAGQASLQPSLFGLEVALAEVWQSWGVRPRCVMGHSLGELSAACVAGLFSLEQGVRLVAERGRLMASLEPPGVMAAVRTDAAGVTSALRPGVSIAAINGPEQVVISGDPSAIEATLAELARGGIESRRLETDCAFHSQLMEPILDKFEEAAAAIDWSPPQTPLVSNVTGRLIDSKGLDANYWRRHARQPVRFADGMLTLAERNIDVFIEIGPQPTTLAMAAGCLGTEAGVWLPSLRKGREAWTILLDSLASFYVHGGRVDWRSFERPYGRSRVDLPHYPFAHRRYWLASAGEASKPPGMVASPESDLEAVRPAETAFEIEPAAPSRPSSAVSQVVDSTLEHAIGSQLNAFHQLVTQQLDTLRAVDGSHSSTARPVGDTDAVSRVGTRSIVDSGDRANESPLGRRVPGEEQP